MTQAVHYGLRVAAVSLAMFAAMAVSVPARLADFPPLAKTPDPGVVPFDNGFIAVGTSEAMGDACDQEPPGRDCHVFPIMYSTDLRRWRRRGYVFPGGKDGAPVPDWINLRAKRGKWLWAPEIEQVGNNLVVHYSAQSEEHNGRRCIGRAATTFTPEAGPNLRFTDLGHPLLCSTPTGDPSLIDPSRFEVGDQAYLLYKRDYSKPEEKDIAIVKIDDKGNPMLGPRDKISGPLLPTTPGWELDGMGTGGVEAPTMIQRKDMYYLFYSGNDYRTDRYAVGVARSKSPTGPFDKHKDNPILTGVASKRFCGVGHQDVVHDVPGGRWLIFYHAFRGRGQEESCVSGVGRFMKVQRLRWNSDGWPFVNRVNKPRGSNTPVEPES